MKKILNSKIFLVIVTAIVFTGIGVFADDIFANQVTYNNTTVDSALNSLYTIVNGVYTSSNVTYNSSYGNGQSTRNTTVTLNQGKYIVATSTALAWPATSSTSSSNELTTSNLSCANNCTISRIYGLANEPHSTVATNSKYQTVALNMRLFVVNVTEDETVITASTGTSNSNPSSLAQAIQVAALKID